LGIPEISAACIFGFLEVSILKVAKAGLASKNLVPPSDAIPLTLQKKVAWASCPCAENQRIGILPMPVK